MLSVAPVLVFVSALVSQVSVPEPAAALVLPAAMAAFVSAPVAASEFVLAPEPELAFALPFAPVSPLLSALPSAWGEGRFRAPVEPAETWRLASAPATSKPPRRLRKSGMRT